MTSLKMSENSVFNDLNKSIINCELKYNKNRLLIKKLKELREEAKELLSIARKYNFRDVEANGFFTLLKLISRFAKTLCERDFKSEELNDVIQVLNEGIQLAHQFHAHSKDTPSLFSTPPNNFVQLLSVFQTLSPQLHVIYGHFSSFWLCQSMRRSMIAMTTLMVFFYAKSNQNLFRSFTDFHFRSQTVAFIAQNASIDFVRRLWSLSELRPLLTLMPALSLARNPKHVTEVRIRRQTKFRICRESACVVIEEESRDLESDVRCRLLRQSESASQHVVLHAHGGGFVAQSPDSHELYLRDWSANLSEAAILSVDYALSPGNRFPEALQQLLDVYLFLFSSKSEITLGFKPKDVVICGDSAGGNLSLALSLVLEYIKRHLYIGIQLPKAILCFYAPFMLQTRGSASRLMTAIDTLLPLGVLLSCLEAYANYGTQEEAQEVPWYRREGLERRLLELNAKTANQWISPLMTSPEEIPRDVTLYLIGLHFDACLDDSVEMARIWEKSGNSVVFDVLDDLPHGFLSFVFASKESQRGSHLCLDRIRQSLA